MGEGRWNEKNTRSHRHRQGEEDALTVRRTERKRNAFEHLTRIFFQRFNQLLLIQPTTNAKGSFNRRSLKDHSIQSPSLTPTKSVKSNIGRTKRQQHQHSPFVFRSFLSSTIKSGGHWPSTTFQFPARLVNLRGRTIRDLTRLPDATPDKICHSKSCPAPGICQQSNVVYVATCILCGEFCVGMTTRKLHDQAREHVLSANKPNNNTAQLGDHYRERHNEKEQPTKKSSKKSKKSSRNESDKIKFKESPKINFKTIKHQPDLLRLHIEEAIAIKQLKPTLNCRQETLGTGFLP